MRGKPCFDSRFDRCEEVTPQMIKLSPVAIRFRNLAASLLVACLMGSIAVDPSLAQDSTEKPMPERWAVILVGLPGDREHEELLTQTADDLQNWLTKTLQFPDDHVLRSPSRTDGESTSTNAISAKTMKSLFDDLKSKLTPNDVLWVFFLGHGNYDGKRAWFHVAGRDPSDEDVGRWLADVTCREQVIWLTQSSSGWFIKALSRPGRIIIAATATDDESNETEFPHVLATVSKWPVSKLDLDHDDRVSVFDLYLSVVNEVLRRFQSDQRLPTEHAQIDDNDDGVGTEITDDKISANPNSESPQIPRTRVDGERARRTIVLFR